MNTAYTFHEVVVKRASTKMLSYLLKKNEFEPSDVAHMKYPRTFLVAATILPRASYLRNKLLDKYWLMWW